MLPLLAILLVANLILLRVFYKADNQFFAGFAFAICVCILFLIYHVSHPS